MKVCSFSWFFYFLMCFFYWEDDSWMFCLFDLSCPSLKRNSYDSNIYNIETTVLILSMERFSSGCFPFRFVIDLFYFLETVERCQLNRHNLIEFSMTTWLDTQHDGYFFLQRARRLRMNMILIYWEDLRLVLIILSFYLQDVFDLHQYKYVFLTIVFITQSEQDLLLILLSMRFNSSIIIESNQDQSTIRKVHIKCNF